MYTYCQYIAITSEAGIQIIIVKNNILIESLFTFIEKYVTIEVKVLI